MWMSEELRIMQMSFQLCGAPKQPWQLYVWVSQSRYEMSQPEERHRTILLGRSRVSYNHISILYFRWLYQNVRTDAFSKDIARCRNAHMEITVNPKENVHRSPTISMKCDLSQQLLLDLHLIYFYTTVLSFVLSFFTVSYLQCKF